MFTVICSLLINMNSSAIQKCLSSNGSSPGQSQGCSHLCVMMWQGSESEQSRLTAQSRGSWPNRPAFLTQLAPQSCSPQPFELPHWPASGSLHWGCWILLPQTVAVSLRRQSLPWVKLHGKLLLPSYHHTPSLILMGYFVASVGWNGLKSGAPRTWRTPHIPMCICSGKMPSKTGKAAALGIFQTQLPATEDDSIMSQKAPTVFTHFVS